MSVDEFGRSYSGVRLLLSPGKEFRPSGRKPGTFDYLRSILSGYKNMMALVMITSVLATFAAILAPVFSAGSLSQRITAFADVPKIITDTLFVIMNAARGG